MRNKLAAIFVTVTLLLCGIASAQVETQVTRKKALLGVTNPVVQGNRILVGEDSNVAVSDVVLLDIRTDYKFTRLKAKQNGNRIEPEKVAEATYLFAGSGSYSVEITVFDPERGIDDREVTFTIGGKPSPPPGPTPEPTPPPDPSVVPNEYGVGLVAFENAPSDTANAKAWAGLYRAKAGQLFGEGGLASIERILSDINTAVAARQCVDKAKCEQWGVWKTKLDAAVKAEQAKRGSFSRQDWYGALTEIATALEAVK
jgi:hypothetical protein